MSIPLGKYFVFGKFDTTYTVLHQVVTTGTVYNPNCVSSDGKNMISFQGTYPNYQTYYSNNYGATWALSNMPTTILGTCCSPVNFPNVFYVGAINASNKVFRSADGGATWTIISTVIGNAAGMCVNDLDTILYISSFGSSMYYSTRAGNTSFNYANNTGTFTLVQITGSNNNFNYTELRCSPDGTFLYGTASSSNRAFKYNFNNTSSFSATLTSTYNTNVCGVAMSSNGAYLYACLYLNANYSLIRSTDGGTTFSDITGVITKNIAALVNCDPTGQYVQVVNGSSWWVSSNYGTTFTVYSGGAIPSAPGIFNNNQFVSLISNTATQYGPLTTPSYPYLKPIPKYVVGGATTQASLGNTFIAYSNDGQNWTQSTNASVIFGYYIRRIANNGSMFVATSGGINNSSATIGYSYDGSTWYPSTNGNSILSTTAMGLAYANGMWVAGGTGNYSLAYSYDGRNWIGSGSSTLFGTGAKAAYVTYKNSTWVAAAYDGTTQAKIAYSSNGINWTLISDTKLDLFVTGIDWNGTNWVAVGRNSANTVQIIYSSSLTGTWTSAPGTSQIFGSSGTFGYSVVWNGSYFLAAGGGSTTAVLARSTDGITWTSSTPAGFSAYNTLIWTGTFWFQFGGYVSGYGTIQTSTDGITWKATTTNPAGTLVESSVSYALNQTIPINATTVPVYNINNANLLYYYPFDNDFLDYKAGSNINSVSNAVTITNASIVSGTTKLDNGSIYFPGASSTSQKVQLPSTTLTTNGVTIAFWAKIILQSGVSPQFIFNFASGGAVNTVGMWLTGTGGFQLMLYNASSVGNSYSLNYTLADANWHHYCVTVTTSGVWSFYVDGVSIAISITSYPTTSAMTTSYIGSNNLGNANINGYMNQFLVFNRELPSVEISYLANYPKQVNFTSTITTPPTPYAYNINNTGLLQYYPFNTDLNNYSTGISLAPSSKDTNANYSVANTKTGSGSIYFGPSNTNGIGLPVFTLGTAGITVAMWIKFVDITTRTIQTRIFEFANGTGTSQQFFSLVTNTTFSSLVIYLEGSVGYTYSYSMDTNWHHYCISINSSGKIIIYVDGVQLGTINTYASYSSVYSSALTTAQIGGPVPAYNAYSVGMKSAYMNQFLCFRRFITSTELSYLVNYPSQVGFSSSITTPFAATVNINNSNLLQYYPFDRDLLNYATGSGVPDGTTNLTNISTTNTKLSIGSLYYPGSANQSFKASNPSLSTTGGMTFSIWGKYTYIPPFNNGSNFRLFDYGTGTNTSGIMFYYQNVTDPSANVTRNALTLYLSGSLNGYYSSFSLQDNNWHHYCFTVSANNTPTGYFTVNIYVDGNSVLSQTVTSSYYPTITTSLGNCLIGQSNYTTAQANTVQPTNYFNQAVVFNRVITATELSYLVNYPSQLQFSSAPTSAISTPVVSTSVYPCFKQGSKILRLDPETDIESYVPVESLRCGDLIKTSQNGHKAIFHIGKKTLPRPANDPDPRNRLYRLPKSISSQMIADLYITGEHCILHKSISEEFKARVRKHMGDVYITEHQYRVPACIDDRAEPYTDNNPVTIWHFALENHSIYRNYGVYANGLLVESCSIQYLMELSNMELVD
jgi:hypothetical protein